VQRGGVGGTAAHDDRDVELVDELLEVERLGLARDVLGRHRGAADHEDVGPGVEDGLVVADGPLRRQPRGGRHPGGPDLLDPAPDQVFGDRLGIDLLQPPGGRVIVELGHLGQQRLGVGEPGPQALEVEHGQAAEAAYLHGRRGRDHAVHRRDHQR